MKFHHNPHVQELLRLGNEVLAGREMQRSRRKISDQISGWLWLIGGSVLLPVIIMHWGTEPDGLKAFPAWRWLVMGLVGDLAARFLHSTLMNGTLQSTEAGVLLHLPISGEILVREAVRTVLLRALVWLPFVAGALVWAAQARPLFFIWLEWPEFILLTAQTTLIIAAQSMWLTFPWLRKLSATFSIFIVLVWLASNWRMTRIDMIWEQDQSVGKAMELLAWLFPTTWPLRLDGSMWGSSLILLWIIAGAWFWRSLPSAIGPDLDQPQNFDQLPSETLPGADELEKTVLIEKAPPTSASNMPEEQADLSDERSAQLNTRVEQLLAEAASSSGRSGWIERCIAGFLSLRERHLLEANTQPTTYTKRWWLAALSGLVLLIAAAAGLTRTGIPVFDEWANIGFVAGMVWLVMMTFPLSNGVELLESYHWGLAQAGLLPVTSRELLKTAQKIALVRAIACWIIVAPAIGLTSYLLGWTTHDPLIVVRVSAVLLVQWTLARPWLVYYRLQNITQPRRGTIFGHYVMCAGLTTLACVSLASCFVSWMVVTGLGPAHSFPSGAIGIALGLLVVHAISSRLAFEWLRSRLRNQKREWVASEDES